jgi:hypothetical protein
MANPLDNEPDVSWGMFWSNVGMFAVAGLAAVYACRRLVASDARKSAERRKPGTPIEPRNWET